MKKLLVLLLTLSVIMAFSLTAAALYDPSIFEPDEEERWNFDRDWGFWDIDDEDGIFAGYSDSKFAGIFEAARGENTEHYVVVDGVTVVTPEGIADNWGHQNATIRVPAQLYIPCYLEMMLVGNAGKTKVKTIGIDEMQNPAIDHGSDRIIMLFHPEITGVLDEDWNFINAGADRVFSSIGPGADTDAANAKTFINACDIFRLQVYGNVGYQVSVTANPFVDGDVNIPIQYRYLVDPEAEAEMNSHDNWSATSSLVDPGFTSGALVPCETHVYFFQFRVPWVHMGAGQYDTDVFFKIYTDDFGNG